MAGRPCTVCIHPDRAQIDARLVAGESRRALAREFGVHHSAMDRHYANHVEDSMRDAYDRLTGGGDADGGGEEERRKFCASI